MDYFLKQIVISKLKIKYVEDVLEKLKVREKDTREEQRVEEEIFKEKVTLYNEVINPEKFRILENNFIWINALITSLGILLLIGLGILSKISLGITILGVMIFLGGNVGINKVGEKLIKKHFRRLRELNQKIVEDYEQEMDFYWNNSVKYKDELQEILDNIKKYSLVLEELKEEDKTLARIVKDKKNKEEEELLYLKWEKEAKDEVLKRVKLKENSSF